MDNTSELGEPSYTEIKQAESMLTPEQRAQSSARYEVIKHKDSLIEAGVDESQVQKAATIASETALKEYQELAAQNPWKLVTDTLGDVITTFDENDRVTAGKLLSRNKSFPTEWKNAIDYVKYEPKSIRTEGIIDNLGVIRKHYHNNPSEILTTHSDGKGVNDFASIRVIESEKKGGLPASAVKSIFEAFGSTPPVAGDKVNDSLLVETKYPGVFLTSKVDGPYSREKILFSNREGGDRILVSFSAEALEKIVTHSVENKV